MSTSNPDRQPAGAPASSGGQFKASSSPASAVELEQPAPYVRARVDSTGAIPEMDEFGTTFWRLNGKLHRLDGPAVEWSNGAFEYWVRGWPHRLDGPAIGYASGGLEYWVDGEIHREDGPAIIRSNGTVEYWIHGVRVSKEDIEGADVDAATIDELHEKKQNAFVRFSEASREYVEAAIPFVIAHMQDQFPGEAGSAHWVADDTYGHTWSFKGEDGGAPVFDREDDRVDILHELAGSFREMPHDAFEGTVPRNSFVQFDQAGRACEVTIAIPKAGQS